MLLSERKRRRREGAVVETGSRRLEVLILVVSIIAAVGTFWQGYLMRNALWAADRSRTFENAFVKTMEFCSLLEKDQALELNAEGELVVTNEGARLYNVLGLELARAADLAALHMAPDEDSEWRKFFKPWEYRVEREALNPVLISRQCNTLINSIRDFARSH